MRLTDRDVAMQDDTVAFLLGSFFDGYVVEIPIPINPFRFPNHEGTRTQKRRMRERARHPRRVGAQS